VESDPAQSSAFNAQWKRWVRVVPSSGVPIVVVKDRWNAAAGYRICLRTRIHALRLQP
jgi:hypothetical protein